METKPTSDWYASKNLRRLIDRWMAVTGKRQGDLPAEAGLEISGEMLSMIIKGKRTITPQNAARLATALRCTIYEICPEMGDFVTKEMLPVLGKALRRAASIAALAVGITAITGFDNKSFAAQSFAQVPVLIHIVRDVIVGIFQFLTSSLRKQDAAINPA